MYDEILFGGCLALSLDLNSVRVESVPQDIPHDGQYNNEKVT
jgi:hypothetical protein